MMILRLLLVVCWFIPLLTAPVLAFGQRQRQFKSSSTSSTLSRNYKHNFNSERSLLFQEASKSYTSTARASSTSSSSSSTATINNRHSASDWLYNLKSLPNSTVLRETRNPVLSLFAWATFISVLQKVLMVTNRTKLAASLCVPHSAHSFLVSSLGMLLVFRTNSAYQRFMEGRKIWEEVLSISRNLSRLTTLYRTEVTTPRLQRIQHLIASFPYLLRHHVRSGCLCNKDFDNSMDSKYRLVLQEPSTRGIVDARYEGDEQHKNKANNNDNNNIDNKCYVDRRDLPWNLLDHDPRQDTLLRVAQASNRPLWVCDRLGQEIVSIPYGPNYTSRERLTLLGSIDKLTNAIGQCERIHQTAVPLNYARHALRSLTMWLWTLPFCLVKDLGLLTGPVTAIIAWLLFGIYQIGHSIEDPFQGSLRLSILCDAIRRDVLGDNELDMGARESAFCVDENDDDDDDLDLDLDLDLLDLDKPSKQQQQQPLKQQKRVHNLEPDFIFPQAIVEGNNNNKLDNLIAEAPKLLLKNGTWTMVGI